MFYSHEILGSRQYGVATIWMVATVGKSANRKITRKAIQEVDVPKACEKILDPGAPLALRLQGNLLYGVSRVFEQQCRYVLSDAEKTQSDIMTFFRVMQTSEIDPQAGKAKRHQITLPDDPNFDPFSVLPNLDLFSNSQQLVFLPSQSSNNASSQYTPLTAGSLSSGRGHSLLNFDLPQSSHSAQSHRLPSDLRQSSPLVKHFDAEDPMADFNPFSVDEFDPFPEIGLNFDADGNLIGIMEDEVDLPPLPGATASAARLLHSQATHKTDLAEKNQEIFGDDGVFILGEEALPDAQPFPRRTGAKQTATSPPESSESSTSEEAVVAPSRKARRTKKVLMADANARISSVEFRGWGRDYIKNMEEARNCKRQSQQKRAKTPAQGKRNAIDFLFNSGIAGVGSIGKTTGAVHPLAQSFAGTGFQAHLQGVIPTEEYGNIEPQGRRRGSSEAFGDEEDEGRRVRRKPEEAVKQGRDPIDNGLGDFSVPEIGMEAAPALNDHHSSSMMPWSRPPSVVPGSSVRGPGSAQKGQPAPSPLVAHGSAFHHIERYSDHDAVYGSDNLPQLHSQDSTQDYDGHDLHMQSEEAGVPIGRLDAAFLHYAAKKATMNADTEARDKEGHVWVDFHQLADPNVHGKHVAAEAFMHVLSLATKNVIIVKQDGTEKQCPFGPIHIGVVGSTFEDYDDMVDELA